MILIINICKEKLHYYEFVKPIEDILDKEKIKFETKHYSELVSEELGMYDKIIICGTSLQDNGFIESVDMFSWIKNYEGKILGICGGMQIIGLVFGGKLKKKTEIGFYFEDFDNFLGLNGEFKVYHLHNNYVKLPKNFINFSENNKNKIPQAIRHKQKEIYGVLFHPEVRQKHLIRNFVMH